jgi:hypothetical protein
MRTGVHADHDTLGAVGFARAFLFPLCEQLYSASQSFGRYAMYCATDLDSDAREMCLGLLPPKIFELTCPCTVWLHSEGTDEHKGSPVAERSVNTFQLSQANSVQHHIKVKITCCYAKDARERTGPLWGVPNSGWKLLGVPGAGAQVCCG